MSELSTSENEKQEQVSQHTPTPWHTHGTDIHAQYVGADGKLHHHIIGVTIPMSRVYGDEGDAVDNTAFIVRAVNAHDGAVDAMKDWLRYAESELHEFCGTEECTQLDDTGELCPKCRPAGCIQMKVATLRAALLKAGVAL